MITNDTSYKVLNVVGMSSKEAKNVLELLGVSVTLQGSGYVTSQSVAENTDITPGMNIVLTLDKKFES